MRSVLLCVLVLLGACSRPSANADTAKTNSEVEAVAGDLPFTSALGPATDRVVAAMKAFGECDKRTAECTQKVRDALHLAQEVVKLASEAKVSARLEPARMRTEAAYRMLAAGITTTLRYYERGERGSVLRAANQFKFSTALAKEAGTLMSQAVAEMNSQAFAPSASKVTTTAVAAAPPRGQVQRDMDGLVKGLENAQPGFKHENVFLVSISNDEYEKDVARAEAQGEMRFVNEWVRWKGGLTYRKVQDFWKLDKATSCFAPSKDDTWFCDPVRL